MLVLFLSIFEADTKIMFVYSFAAPLKLAIRMKQFVYRKLGNSNGGHLKMYSLQGQHFNKKTPSHIYSKYLEYIITAPLLENIELQYELF